MKTLLVLRHAKSSWTDPGRDDHDRTLNARGRRGAAAMGAWIAEAGLLPDQVMCSDAVRTRETWTRTNLLGAVELRSDLYHASAETMLQLAKEASGTRVMMIGHNPGIADFCRRVAITPPDHKRFAQYPTCALTVLTLDTDDWAELDWKTGTVAGFLTPSDLGVRKS